MQTISACVNHRQSDEFTFGFVALDDQTAASVVVSNISRLPQLNVPDTRIRPAVAMPLFNNANGAALRAHRPASRHCVEYRRRARRHQDQHCRRRRRDELPQDLSSIWRRHWAAPKMFAIGLKRFETPGSRAVSDPDALLPYCPEYPGRPVRTTRRA